MFCIHCGTELPDNAAFCRACGRPVTGSSPAGQGPIVGPSGSSSPNPPLITPPSTAENYSARSRVREYAGRVYNCPNCGEPLPSFVTNCPSCGAEIRGAGTSHALEVFHAKLDMYTYQPEPFTYNENAYPELMETASDTEETRKQKRKELQKRIDAKKEEHEERENERKDSMTDQLANLIKTYPVPNTKEDMLEFLIFAYSHIDFDRLRTFDCDDNEIKLANAWAGMVRQIYMRAGQSFQDEEEFVRIAEIYNECVQNMESGKKTRRTKWMIFWFGLFGSMGIVAVIAFLANLLQ